MGDGQITTWAMERLSRLSEQPFFLAVGYYRPHIPLWAPQKYFDLFSGQSIVLPDVLADDLQDLSEVGKRWAIDPVTAGSHATVVEHMQWQAAVTAYLACVAFVDAQIGRLLDGLGRSTHANNTLTASIMVCSGFIRPKVAQPPRLDI